jgi:hypothetical protein
MNDKDFFDFCMQDEQFRKLAMEVNRMRHSYMFNSRRYKETVQELVQLSLKLYDKFAEMQDEKSPSAD